MYYLEHKRRFGLYGSSLSGNFKRDNTRDNRYIQGVEFDEFVEQLRELNDRDIDYIVSYDGKTGDKFIGKLYLNH